MACRNFASNPYASPFCFRISFVKMKPDMYKNGYSSDVSGFAGNVLSASAKGVSSTINSCNVYKRLFSLFRNIKRFWKNVLKFVVTNKRLSIWAKRWIDIVYCWKPRYLPIKSLYPFSRSLRSNDYPLDRMTGYKLPTTTTKQYFRNSQLVDCRGQKRKIATPTFTMTRRLAWPAVVYTQTVRLERFSTMRPMAFHISYPLSSSTKNKNAKLNELRLIDIPSNLKMPHRAARATGGQRSSEAKKKPKWTNTRAVLSQRLSTAGRCRTRIPGVAAVA